MTPGVSPMLTRKLLHAFESPGAILRAGLSDLQRYIPAATAEKLKNGGGVDAAKAAIHWAEGSQKHILTIADPQYPSLLLELSDAPLLLFAHGDTAFLNNNIISIVGSRNASPGGAKNTEIFARTLSETGFCVASGMAQGIDSAAHIGALQSSGGTIAVIGTGIDDLIYPKENRRLAEKIIAGGVIISEFPLGAPPLAKNFPRRNRLISGISRACLVVEATIKSGSLITARLAAEQGREVFAVPGSINSPMHRGCHALIKQGAKLAENINDILEELEESNIPLPSPLPITEESATTDDNEEELLTHIDFEPMTIDEVAQKSQIPMDKLLPKLLELEIAGKSPPPRVENISVWRKVDSYTFN